MLKLFSGVLMDKRGHAKGWVAGGYGLAALSRPLSARLCLFRRLRAGGGAAA